MEDVSIIINLRFMKNNKLERVILKMILNKQKIYDYIF